MKTGLLYNSNDTKIGVKVSEKGKKLNIESYFSDSKELLNVKKPVIGLPFEFFITKSVKIPKVSREELKKTEELQVKFLLGENAYNTHMINTEILEHGNSYILFIVAAEVPEEFQKVKNAVIVPGILGIFAFANKEKMFDSTETVMLIYITKDYTRLIVVNEGSIAFMRSFPAGSDINSEIKLSEQLVYRKPERSFFKIKKLIVFYTDEKIKKVINRKKTEEIIWHNVSDFIKNGQNCFLSYGLSLYDYSEKKISEWNVGEKPPSITDSLRRAMFWLVPVFIIFLPLYYYGDYYQDIKKIQTIEGEVKLLSKKTMELDSLIQKISKAENLISKYAEPLLRYAKLYNAVYLINKYRPDNLRLTNLTGKSDEEFTLTGYADNFSQISDLIKKLNTSKFFDTLNLNYSNTSSKNKVNFQMTMQLAPGFDFLFTENKNDSPEKPNKRITPEKPVSVVRNQN
ncbi:MAG: PilN domain-containing protein [Victivallales bacterium]|nr:PilN domain-containing protein [Victivallales bacterium]MCF7888769.1 PilN domain-containing protein [Victivallales bacterium]